MSRNRSAATGGCIYDRCYFYIVPYYFKQCTDLPVPVSDSRHKCRKRSGIPSACRSAPKQQHILPYIPQDTFLCRFIRRPDRRLSPSGRSVSLESAGILPHGIGSPLDHALRPPSAARRHQNQPVSRHFLLNSRFLVAVSVHRMGWRIVPCNGFSRSLFGNLPVCGLVASCASYCFYSIFYKQ